MNSPTISKPIAHAVNELILFIDNNPLNRESISTLFPHYFSNRNTIYPAFKCVKGQPIDEYRAFKLMEAAASMIADGELTIRQVAYKCGFHGQKAPSNFSRAFRKAWKITPKEWQKRNGTVTLALAPLSNGILYVYSNN
jgi:AraC-like DNA-binding protein